MTTSIYFVRHAVSPFRIGQDRIRPLSAKGLQASRKVAELLAHEGIDAVISSPYTRAVETVSLLAEQVKLPVVTVEALRERAVGSMDIEIGREQFLTAMRASFADKDYCLPGGETIHEAQGRAIPSVKRLLQEYRGGKLAVGTHGNVMTAIFNYYDDRYGFDFWQRTTMPDVYRVDFDGERWLNMERLWQEGPHAN
jgi:2,3-bisphosphoglycerate-dependent phosphoglycerate mutase